MRLILFFLLSFFTTVGAALAASDVTAPVVQSFSFTPDSGDVTAGLLSVTATSRVTDDLSGVTQVTVSFSSPSGHQHASVTFHPSTRLSGTIKDGVYQNIMELPRYAEAGEWHPASIVTVDAVGNISVSGSLGNSSSPFSADFDRPLTIRGTSDLTPPVVQSLTFSPSTGDVSDGPLTVTITAHITDDLYGTSAIMSTEVP